MDMKIELEYLVLTSFKTLHEYFVKKDFNKSGKLSATTYTEVWRTSKCDLRRETHA